MSDITTVQYGQVIVIPWYKWTLANVWMLKVTVAGSYGWFVMFLREDGEYELRGPAMEEHLKGCLIEKHPISKKVKALDIAVKHVREWGKQHKFIQE